MGGMTPERRADILLGRFQTIGHGTSGVMEAYTIDAIRAAVAEAYEDAARIAGEYPYGTDPRHIAAAIRARAKED